MAENIPKNTNWTPEVEIKSQCHCPFQGDGSELVVQINHDDERDAKADFNQQDKTCSDQTPTDFSTIVYAVRKVSAAAYLLLSSKSSDARVSTKICGSRGFQYVMRENRSE